METRLLEHPSALLALLILAIPAWSFAVVIPASDAPGGLTNAVRFSTRVTGTLGATLHEHASVWGLAGASGTTSTTLQAIGLSDTANCPDCGITVLGGTVTPRQFDSQFLYSNSQWLPRQKTPRAASSTNATVGLEASSAEVVPGDATGHAAGRLIPPTTPVTQKSTAEVNETYRIVSQDLARGTPVNIMGSVSAHWQTSDVDIAGAVTTTVESPGSTTSAHTVNTTMVVDVGGTRHSLSRGGTVTVTGHPASKATVDFGDLSSSCDRLSTSATTTLTPAVTLDCMLSASMPIVAVVGDIVSANYFAQLRNDYGNLFEGLVDPGPVGTIINAMQTFTYSLSGAPGVNNVNFVPFPGNLIDEPPTRALLLSGLLLLLVM